MKDRVLIFAGAASPIGGVETWLDQICDHLGRTDLRPIVGLARGLASHDPDRFRSFHDALETVDVDGRGLTAEGRIRALARCIKRVKPGVVVLTSLVEANQAVSRCKNDGQNVRLIVHAQGNLPEMLADLKTFRNVIDHVVCPGRLTEKTLCSWGQFSTNEVTHIPNGSLSARTPRRANPNPALRIGYVGRFSQMDKRILDLVPFLKQLRATGVPFSMRIVGKGAEETTLKMELQEMPEVTFEGMMTQEELYQRLYPELDVLVLFSSSEAFGIVLAEAMMNGVVPVTSQFVGFHAEKLVLDNATGLSFPVGDVRKAIEQVLVLHRDRERLRTMSRQGRQHTEETYSWTGCLTRWESCIRQVLEQSPKSVNLPCKPLSLENQGRLDQLRVPAGIIDLLRRIKRKWLGVSIPAGGIEWPLYNTHYSAKQLKEVVVACQEIEASCQ